MEWKNNLRRVQSMKSIPSSCDKPAWTDVGLRDRKTSVSDLVSRYQTTEKVTVIQTTVADDGKGKTKQMVKEIKPRLVEKDETNLETLMRRNEERERSRVRAGLTRSVSMGSLQNSAVSIEALKAQFESKDSAQNKAKRSFRAANFTSPSAADVPVMNGEVKDARSPAEEKTRQTHVDRVDAKEEQVTQKVVNRTRTERRKTIGGIDFEKIAASQDEEKRRSVADFRDSSFIQTKEKLSVSVKAMSALYLSKVAPKESTHSSEQDQSRKSGKGVKLVKMSEASTSQQRKDEIPPPPSAGCQSGREDFSGAHPQQHMASQISKEKFYQQRKKCELRRLLKHTHPELKMLDDVVDEELAEVLSSEGSTAGEIGYEGEVFSRCLIFENCGQRNQVSPYTSKTHMAEGTVERCDFSKTPAVSEEPHAESVKEITEDDKSVGFSPDPTRECEEEMIRIDVQATRRIFENQSVNTSRPNPDNKFQGKVSISEDETKAVQKQKKQFEICSKDNLHSKCKSMNTDVGVSCSHDVGKCTDISGEEVSSGEAFFEEDSTSLPDSERFTETIKTSAALLQNNPFISTNIEREHSYVNTGKTQIQPRDSRAAEEYLTANVKNRTHLFESMPFDKIRHQNKDEIETMVENIKETLNFLYSVEAIQSTGSVIEVNETMIAKKAKFTLSESGPEIKYDEVAEGGAQNFIVQLLPRINLKPQITYLKEDSKGCMEATVVNVPVHQHQFNTSKDIEFKTANVVQLIEDILSQDNSLRKGVIIQEEVHSCANVIVYSLYNYFDEEDVKRYSPPQGTVSDKPEPVRGDTNKETRKDVSEAAISGHPDTSQDQGSIRPEIKVKGNVKLFKSCIDKGDLEYLKTLQAEATVQEQDTELQYEQRADQTEESTSEWVPVDVKRLKSMFSGDQSQIEPKKNISDNRVPSATIGHAFTDQNVSHGKNQFSPECSSGINSNVQVNNTFRECSGEAQEDVCYLEVLPQTSKLHFDQQDDDSVHQAELVEVIDDSDEIFNLQTAIQSLQQATIEAKSLCHSSEEKQKILTEESPGPKHSRTEAKLPQENEDQSASNFIPVHKSDFQQKNIEACHEETNSADVQMTETCGKECQKGTVAVQKQTTTVSESSSAITKQEDEEVVFEGKIQAALESLERSNINVSRGDFKAAMIYRNSSRPHQERMQNVDVVSVLKSSTGESGPVTEAQVTNQVQLRKEVTAGNAEPPNQTGTPNKPAMSVVSEKSKRPIRPKPAIPPKPEHLKVKERDNQSANIKTPEAILTKTVRLTETAPQVSQLLPKTSLSCKDEHIQDLFKINSSTVLIPDSGDCQRNEPSGEDVWMSQEAEAKHQVQGSTVTSEHDDTDRNLINGQQDTKATGEEKSHQDVPAKDNLNETDEKHLDFHEACQKFGGKKAMKIAPVKPKRVKIAQPDNKQPGGENVSAHGDPKPVQIVTDPSVNICGQTAVSKDKQEKEMKPDSKVEMREKKGRTETEDERRQRLSVHMDEIMRGNMTAAMEIFDNLRKQEELESILSRVEEIEQDTSDVDVRSLRRVFEDVPDWVVSSDEEKQRKVKVEDKSLPLLRESTESKSSMAHVFGDLERASEEIMNLKEQTLARLVDIEQAIKKALFSVSTLKSDSDIAGLSCLFRESLGTVKDSPSSGNISKISIGSSRTKAQESAKTQGSTGKPARQSIEVASAKQRSSPLSSPAFISIQSAARKMDKRGAALETSICPACKESPKLEEKFRTTKTLTCNSPAQNRRRNPRKGGQKQSTSSPLNPHRELSVLEVHTDREGNSIIGTKTVTENYERTDNFGNRFYSTKTSTVVTTQPDTTTTTSTSQAVISPTTYQVTTYPEVQLPINQINPFMPK
uniref:Xin actin-binding repeat-containing protein 1-like n=4 Tax=Amphiprion ocellaris TaxID=80972 RepID=A0AAQ5ZCT0_AMPOC